jgi:hypothetical protein
MAVDQLARHGQGGNYVPACSAAGDEDFELSHS